MSTELFEKFTRKINTLRKHPSKTVMRYVYRAESRLVGYQIPQLDHYYEKLFRVEKGDVVIDVGAHIGLFAYSVEKRAKTIVAIECDPKNVEQLRYNLRNSCNVLIVEKALWNRKGRLPLYLGYSSADHSLIRDVQFEHRSLTTNRQIIVDADTLDSVLCDLKIAKADFVKMDIEGAEVEALEGATESLKNLSKIVVASYHERNGEKTIHKVVRKLADNGFKVYTTVDDLVYGLKKQK